MPTKAKGRTQRGGSGGPVPTSRAGLCLGPPRMTAQSLRLQHLRKGSRASVPKNEVPNSYSGTSVDASGSAGGPPAAVKCRDFLDHATSGI